MSFTLKAEPRRAYLTDEFVGVWPTFAVGMQDAETNFKSFIAMSPSQIMVAGSVSLSDSSDQVTKAFCARGLRLSVSQDG